MAEKLQQIHQTYLEKIGEAKDLKTLDDIFLALFGKNGEITSATKDFPKLNREELKIVAPLLAKIKAELEEKIEQKRVEIREESYTKLKEEQFDVPAFPDQVWEAKKRVGHLHLLTQFENETAKLFKKLGFQQIDAPHIDTDDYNFELLNIPKDHPARDMWDTFYISSEKFGINPGKILLRTHTSNSQIRIMEKFKPPIRMMNIGRCFRYENVDARHEHTFDQFEIVLVDKGVSMTNLQYLSEYFLKAIFGPEIKVRLRPKYYPFVEPGAGVDGLCLFCKGEGCKVCGGTGWLELAGAGMIHPQVLKNGGIDPKVYSGIAWGFGPERMVMLKHGINDLRVFKSGDIKFLEKF